jgi:hypothetical protein
VVSTPAPVIIWCVVVRACTGRAVGSVGDVRPEPVADAGAVAVAGAAELAGVWVSRGVRIGDRGERRKERSVYICAP